MKLNYYFFKNFTNGYPLGINKSINSKKNFNNSKDIYNCEEISKDLLALIVGFIDGDGFIRISKKLKTIYPSNSHKYYVYVSLIINLHNNDLDLLKYFNLYFKIGKVYNITPKKGNKLARWEINKTELINVFIPLLEKYNISFLTETRQKQYLLLKYIINNNIIDYKDIVNNKKNIDIYIDNNMIVNNFNSLSYFNNWLVGFSMAEGSFLIKKNNDFCFQIKQKYNFELLKDISSFFKTNRKLNINKNKYVQFNVSSKHDIQNIIKYFSYSNNHTLLGEKLISYHKWLHKLKHSERYKDLNIPY